MVTRFKLRKTKLGSHEKRSGRASKTNTTKTLIYVVKNAQTHAVPMGKALNEARVYRTTDRCSFHFFPLCLSNFIFSKIYLICSHFFPFLYICCNWTVAQLSETFAAYSLQGLQGLQLLFFFQLVAPGTHRKIVNREIHFEGEALFGKLWICLDMFAHYIGYTYIHTYIYIYVLPSDIAPSRSNWNLTTYMIEGSLEVKLPTIWRDKKQSREEAEGRERLEERRVEEKE